MIIRSHEFLYSPITIGAQKRYNLDLPADQSPVRFWTITSDMQSWIGEVTKVSSGVAEAVVRQHDGFMCFSGFMSSMLKIGHPCYVMEHLTIDGQMEYLVGAVNIQMGNKNFINFGTPNGKHLRIDIYTGESRIINDYC